MGHGWWRAIAATTLGVALWTAGCASGSNSHAEATADGGLSAPQTAASANGPAAATTPATGSPFALGYRAYQGHDLAQAIEQLQLATHGPRVLADYAVFYLGSAQRDQGQLESAAASFRELSANYPQSVFATRTELALADLALKQGNYAEAAALSARLIASAPGAPIEPAAMLILARAQVATGDVHAAYGELQSLRHKFSRGKPDGDARSLVSQLLSEHPELVNESSVEYQRGEAELLLDEGQDGAALKHIQAAFALKPALADRAELFWLEAQAVRSDPELERQALQAYLKLAPAGPSAPAALERLGRIYSAQDNTDQAMALFSRLVLAFPKSQLAPEAMLRIGRIHEELDEMNQAREEYRQLAARYPGSEAAAQARFRGPWTLYLVGDYAAAARGFEVARTHTTSASERDMFSYWHARALQKSGDDARAHEIFAQLAASTDSNYYPSLAARQAEAIAILPAQALPADPARPQLAGEEQFHLERAFALKGLGLVELERDELLTLREGAYVNGVLRNYLLVAMQSADAWRDAIVMAQRMMDRGVISPPLAEPIRYPRAFWSLLQPASTRTGIDAFLLLALTRQESLFDPNARSGSDARGLMQLLPATADAVARRNGIAQGGMNLFNPQINVELGSIYLKELFQMFGGDPFRAVAAYNAGEHAVQKWDSKFHGDDDEWVENIEYRETRDYVKKVLGGQREYRLLYPSPGGA